MLSLDELRACGLTREAVGVRVRNRRLHPLHRGVYAVGHASPPLGGFARPDVNVPLVIDGRRIVPDFRWPAQRLILEADGAAWHDDPLARADDAEAGAPR